MFGRKKRRLLICSAIISITFGCSSNKASIPGFEISGETQGTTYSIIVAEDQLNFTQIEIDALLKRFDDALSTYVNDSKISQLNNSTEDFSFIDSEGFFKTCYTNSRDVYEASNGMFDPSVFPLIEGWGFFKHIDTPLIQTKIDSILTFVSFDENKLHKIVFSNDSVLFTKLDPRFKLDFNAIAQGQSIDVLYDFLESKGHENFYVEVGGELRVKGTNRDGEKWRIGIDTPKELNSGTGTRSISGILNIENKAVATSGNYRNFYEKDGKKFSHTLNPKTGYPVKHNLLSATVITDNCALADAYATVFMVIGLEKTRAFLAETKRNLEAVLIYEDEKGKLSSFSTKGAQSMIE